MHRSGYLALATTIGSAICWWPSFVWQDYFPHNQVLSIVAVAFIAILTGSSTYLSGGHWVRYWLLSSVATFAGVLAGGYIWPSKDPEANSWLGLVAIVATFVVFTVSLLAVLASRFLLRLKER